jgi:hypothetical protein
MVTRDTNMEIRGRVNYFYGQKSKIKACAEP